MLLTISIVISSIVAIILVNWFMVKLNRRNSPPTISGWIPWMGVGVEFGVTPLRYINNAKYMHGPVFTVLAAGKYLTFLMDVDDHRQYFFNSKSVDFQQAVVDAVQNTASLTPELFLKYHTDMHDLMKGRLAPSQHNNYYADLSNKFSKEICKLHKRGEMDLMKLIRKVMFGAVVKNLFGEGIVSGEEKMQELEDIFVKFDDQFEYGSQIPGFLLRDWAACKQWLLKLFTKFQNDIKPQSSKSMTLGQQMMSEVGKVGPNFALMLLWASQANAIPISFWVIAFLLDDPEEMKKVSAELNDVLGDKQTDLIIDEKIIGKLPSIKRCILETIRLRSPGVIARKVIKSFHLKGYTIPAGDMLMISPYWAHRDPRYFPDPHAFKPDRWLAADLDKNLFLDGFVGFGGGRYQCPGRWFALMEMHVLITLLLQQLSFTALGPLPKPSQIHVVGTQHPEHSYHVTFSK
ncbi:24-hydroxycholesterol 7-alpha-hydroxylase-like [Antedon mediterranea]|uniref:24-hydroxycholesterol 7-alpha-hydroxylase-like n=1 Tax=Antedon mediterranea TaxID=105859 RepID=UPI003AF615CD